MFNNPNETQLPALKFLKCLVSFYLIFCSIKNDLNQFFLVDLAAVSSGIPDVQNLSNDNP